MPSTQECHLFCYIVKYKADKARLCSCQSAVLHISLDVVQSAVSRLHVMFSHSCDVTRHQSQRRPSPSPPITAEHRTVSQNSGEFQPGFSGPGSEVAEHQSKGRWSKSSCSKLHVQNYSCLWRCQCQMYSHKELLFELTSKQYNKFWSLFH